MSDTSLLGLEVVKTVSKKEVINIETIPHLLTNTEKSTAISDRQFELVLQNRAQCLLHRGETSRLAAVRAWRFNGTGNR